ncbi:MAG: MFS transporter, partial [Chloroflexota bacterium]
SKRLLVLQFGILSLTLFWLAVIRQPWSIFVFAFVFGFAFGGIVPLYSHFVAHLFGLRAHGAILGTIGFSIGIGSAIGPVFTGYCYDILGGYAVPFAVCGVLAVTSALFIAAVRPPHAVHLAEELHVRSPEPPFPTTL